MDDRTASKAVVVGVRLLVDQPMSSKDLEKIRESRRKWYRNNRVHAKAKVMERKRRILLWFVQYKDDLSCERCGNDDSRVLEFHHRDRSEKIANVAELVHNGFSKENIIAEVNKCEVLCANCHRIEHYTRP